MKQAEAAYLGPTSKQRSSRLAVLLHPLLSCFSPPLLFSSPLLSSPPLSQLILQVKLTKSSLEVKSSFHSPESKDHSR